MENKARGALPQTRIPASAVIHPQLSACQLFSISAFPTARRMRARHACGDFFNECCQIRITFQPQSRSWRTTRRSRAMLSSRFLSQNCCSWRRQVAPFGLRSSVGYPRLSKASVFPVGFRAGVALRAAVPEPSLWEQTRKTTEGSPKGVAPFAGKQMPSNIRRQRRRSSASGTQSRACRAKEDAFSSR